MLENIDQEVIERRLSRILAKTNHYCLCGIDLVRVPQIKGKIYIYRQNHVEKVEYIYKSWYDAKNQQMRNRKALIGEVFELYQCAMIPKKQYERFFDMETGELKPIPDEADDPEEEAGTEEPERTAEPKTDWEAEMQRKKERLAEVLMNQYCTILYYIAAEKNPKKQKT